MTSGTTPNDPLSSMRKIATRFGLEDHFENLDKAYGKLEALEIFMEGMTKFTPFNNTVTNMLQEVQSLYSPITKGCLDNTIPYTVELQELHNKVNDLYEKLRMSAVERLQEENQE